MESAAALSPRAIHRPNTLYAPATQTHTGVTSVYDDILQPCSIGKSKTLAPCVAGNLQRSLHDVPRREGGVRDERAGGGERVRPARADGDDAVVRLDELSVARDHEAVFAVGHGEQRLEPPQHTVAPPLLRQLDRGTGYVAGIALELLLELLEEGERVRHGAGEARQQAAAAQEPDLLRVVLHYRIADGHLPVAAQSDFPVAADGEDGGGTDARQDGRHARQSKDSRHEPMRRPSAAWSARRWGGPRFGRDGPGHGR